MTDAIEIIHSPLTRIYSADGHTLHIQIYRSPGSPWVLEVVDEYGTSTVWDGPFGTDQAALEAAFLQIEQEGIHAVVSVLALSVGQRRGSVPVVQPQHLWSSIANRARTQSDELLNTLQAGFTYAGCAAAARIPC